MCFQATIAPEFFNSIRDITIVSTIATAPMNPLSLLVSEGDPFEHWRRALSCLRGAGSLRQLNIWLPESRTIDPRFPQSNEPSHKQDLRNRDLQLAAILDSMEKVRVRVGADWDLTNVLQEVGASFEFYLHTHWQLQEIITRELPQRHPNKTKMLYRMLSIEELAR